MICIIMYTIVNKPKYACDNSTHLIIKFSFVGYGSLNKLSVQLLAGLKIFVLALSTPLFLLLQFLSNIKKYCTELDWNCINYSSFLLSRFMKIKPAISKCVTISFKQDDMKLKLGKNVGRIIMMRATNSPWSVTCSGGTLTNELNEHMFTQRVLIHHACEGHLPSVRRLCASRDVAIDVA